jgi:glucose 1-dehydrogenase
MGNRVQIEDPAIRRKLYPLAGQRALVTGASSGIGACLARGLAGAGARVAVNYIGDADAAESLVEEIRGYGIDGVDALAIRADVSNELEVREMFRQAFEAWGSIDILVNNAGLQQDAPLHQMTLAQWNKVLDVNLTGQFLCAREAVREFMRRGRVPELSRSLGKIVCISSVHEVIPWGGHINYAASKGGVMLMMKSMAQELAPLGIRVNSICPGAIKTPINRAAWETPQAEAELLRLIPYGRVGETRDLGSAAVWLASDASDYVTGVSLFVDGGMTLYPGFAEGG